MARSRASWPRADRARRGPSRDSPTPRPARRRPGAVVRAEPGALDRAADRSIDGRVLALPAAGRGDRGQRALAAVGEGREQELVVGSGPAPARGQRPGDLDRGERALERVRGETRTVRHSLRISPARFSRYSGIRIIGGRSWSASSITSRPQPAVAGPGQLHRRAELGEEAGLAPLLEPLHDGLEDDEAHPADRPSSSWLRWIRRSRSTWPRPSRPTRSAASIRWPISTA